MTGGDSGARRARIASAQRILATTSLDALLVSDLANIRHLCGFTGSNGLLVVQPERAVFFTDSRYTLQARGEVEGADVVEAAELEPAVGKFLAEAEIRTLGFEEKGVSVARWRKLGDLIPQADRRDASDALDALRCRKDPAELRALREAARLAEEAFRRVLPRLTAGTTEAEVALAYHHEALSLGAESLAFDTIVASGPRGALPHARPGGRRLQRGDLVVFDFGIRLDGYCADETVTVPIGSVEEGARQVYDTVLAAQTAALTAIRPGVALTAVDEAARGVIRKAGFADHFGHGTGHGVGLAVHEPPTVSQRSKDSAEAGMVFTVEPGVYLPERFGVRIEDCVVVTPDGCERITSIPKDFGAVWAWLGMDSE